MKLKYHGRNKYPGVGMYRAVTGRRWVATGFLCGQKLNLGSFDTPERASLAGGCFVTGALPAIPISLYETRREMRYERVD